MGAREMWRQNRDLCLPVSVTECRQDNQMERAILGEMAHVTGEQSGRRVHKAVADVTGEQPDGECIRQ